MEYPLTAEQHLAVEHFRTGENLKIEAFAGAGKTSTLIALAKAAAGKGGHYFAFNRSIADDAWNRFPRSVSTSTVHSVARRFVAQKFGYSKNKLTDNPSAHHVAHAFQAQPKEEYLLTGNTNCSGREYSSLILRTCQRFLASADEEPMPKHFMRDGKLKALTPEEFENFAQTYTPAVQDLWREMQNPNAEIPLGHDGYLKLWGLAKPSIQKDFILLDEAQDTSDLVLDVLSRQEAQIVYVGDEYQQIYEFRGAVSAMKKVSCPKTVSLTKSFRFGQQVADAATLVLAELGCRRRIIGNSTVLSKVGPHQPNAVLCRSNIGVIDRLLGETEQGRTVHVLGGTRALISLLLEVHKLKRGIPSRHPDLFGYVDWNDVLESCESGDCGSLKVLVRLVTRFGEQRIIDRLKTTKQSEADAHVVVSTAHKAKGREWNRVEVASDFDTPYLHSKEDVEPEESEMRLFYVAMTRSKTHLALPPNARTYFAIG